MESLNCKSLMIGDYVKYQGHIYIVEEISAKGWVHLLYADTRTRVNLTSDYVMDELQPIPISPEEGQLRHWQDVRERAAIAAMQGLLAQSGDAYLESVIAKEAIIYADALVEELKGDKYER